MKFLHTLPKIIFLWLGLCKLISVAKKVYLKCDFHLTTLTLKALADNESAILSKSCLIISVIVDAK